MAESWVNISIPESVQEQAQTVDLPYHRLIVLGIRAHEGTIDEARAIEMARDKLDEWEAELRVD